MKKVIFLLNIVVFLIAGCKEDITPIPEKLITFELTSQLADDTYRIRVHLPDSYTPSNTYPVLYQLDGSTTTGSVIKNYDNLQQSNETIEIIIVTIDYVSENERRRDFTPTSHPQFNNSGGAANFLQFLSNELIPYIDAEYATDATFGNTLRGHSLGGLFASYVMFENNGTFQHYIIESPSWWWDDNYSIGQEFEYAQTNDDLPAKAYFAVGGYEGAAMKGSFEVIRDRLQSRNYPSFVSQFEILSKQDHLDVRDNANGLRVIFGR